MVPLNFVIKCCYCLKKGEEDTYWGIYVNYIYSKASYVACHEHIIFPCVCYSCWDLCTPWNAWTIQVVRRDFTIYCGVQIIPSTGAYQLKLGCKIAIYTKPVMHAVAGHLQRSHSRCTADLNSLQLEHNAAAGLVSQQGKRSYHHTHETGCHRTDLKISLMAFTVLWGLNIIRTLLSLLKCVFRV